MVTAGTDNLPQTLGLGNPMTDENPNSPGFGVGRSHHHHHRHRSSSSKRNDDGDGNPTTTTTTTTLVGGAGGSGESSSNIQTPHSSACLSQLQDVLAHELSDEELGKM